MLFISVDHRPAIVSPASKAVRHSDGRGGVVVCVFASVSVCACACMRACAMCLQYTVMIFYPGR